MDNRRGILLMLLAMLMFSMEDALIKVLSRDWSTAQVLLVIGIGGGAILVLLARRTGQPILHRDNLHWAVVTRSLAEAVATLLFVTALATAPLGMTSAIIQAAPLALVAGSAILLGEPVGWRRWTAVSVGFAGVILIVRPWGGAFDPALLLAVAATAALATRDLVTRRVPAGVGTFALSSWAYAGVVLAACVSFAREPRLEPLAFGDLPAVAALLTLSTVGYYAVTASMRVGEVSAVAPFRYTRLVFAAVLGFLIFDEVLDAMSLLGAVLIIGSGIYAMIREGRAARRPVASAVRVSR